MSNYSIRKQILLWLRVNTYGGSNDHDQEPEPPNKSRRLSDHLTIKSVGLDSYKSWRHVEGTQIGGSPIHLHFLPQPTPWPAEESTEALFRWLWAIWSSQRRWITMEQLSGVLKDGGNGKSSQSQNFKQYVITWSSRWYEVRITPDLWVVAKVSGQEVESS